jgi:hypothetical protein
MVLDVLLSNHYKKSREMFICKTYNLFEIEVFDCVFYILPIVGIKI